MQVIVQNESYEFCDRVREDSAVRSSFDMLTKETYGFSFEQWYRDGWWSDRYTPNVLIKDGKVVANVSVNRMDMTVNGRLRHYIQLGTVMTAKECRNRGLCRVILERVLEQYRGDCDGIYLFANDSVLNFYPKFGFTQKQEWEYSLPVSGAGKARNMNLEDQNDLECLLEHYRRSNPFSALAMVDNPGLLMFYCMGGLSGQVWFVPEQDAVVIAGVENGRRILYDVYCSPGRSLEEIASAVSGGDREVVLGFTPENPTGMIQSIHKEENTTLFWLSGGDDTMWENAYMFPSLSHA